MITRLAKGKRWMRVEGEVKRRGNSENKRFSNTEWNGETNCGWKSPDKHASGLAFTLLFIVTSDIQFQPSRPYLSPCWFLGPTPFIPGNSSPLPQYIFLRVMRESKKQKDLIRIRSQSLHHVGSIRDEGSLSSWHTRGQWDPSNSSASYTA